VPTAKTVGPNKVVANHCVEHGDHLTHHRHDHDLRESRFYVLDEELQFMNWELQLTRPVRTHRSDLPEIIRTLGGAVDMIDEHLAETLRIRPVWQQVKDMLVTAAETRTAQDVETATTLLERALLGGKE
jgi:hypothetical protein